MTWRLRLGFTLAGAIGVPLVVAVLWFGSIYVPDVLAALAALPWWVVAAAFGALLGLALTLDQSQ